ncbi:MAG: DUF6174 domain-containing protein [Nocardioides sp.]|nr:DUF6174 domain-containing protein [Nocardioides sp.]
MRTLLALALTSVLALSACGSENDDSTATDNTRASGTPSPSALPLDGKDPAQNLENARAMWDQGEIEDYEWTVARVCFCPRVTARIAVQGGTATSLDETSGDKTSADVLGFATMDELFELVDKALTEADDVRASYDPQTGAVKKVVIDQIKGAVDDEMTYVVKNVQPAG